MAGRTMRHGRIARGAVISVLGLAVVLAFAGAAFAKGSPTRAGAPPPTKPSSAPTTAARPAGSDDLAGTPSTPPTTSQTTAPSTRPAPGMTRNLSTATPSTATTTAPSTATTTAPTATTTRQKDSAGDGSGGTVGAASIPDQTTTPPRVASVPPAVVSAPVTGLAPAPVQTRAAAPDAPPPAARVAPAPSVAAPAGDDSQMAAGPAPVPSAGPVTAAEVLSVRPTPSEGLAVLLALLVVLFLALHGRVDGGDPRLGGGVSGLDSGRFE